MSDQLSETSELMKLEKKLINTRYQRDFVDEVRKMDKQQLDSKLLDLAKYGQAVKSTMQIDEQLIDAKDTVKGLERPYKNDIRDNKEKARFVALIMEENFGEIK